MSRALTSGSQGRLVPRAKALFMVLGPWSFLMSGVSITAGFFLGSLPQFRLGFFLLALALVVPVHASSNLLNDCFDVVTGADNAGTRVYKPHPILTGVLSLRSTAVYAALLLGLGALSCAALVLLGRPYSVAILSAALLLMLAYNVPPVRLKDRGYGELLVFLVWGPLMFVGAFYLQTGLVSASPVLFSVPMGMLVASVLLVDDINDMKEDTKIGRRTAPILLGRQRALQLYATLVLSSYLVAAVVSLLYGRVGALIVLASLPLTLRTIGGFRRHLPEVSPDRLASRLMVGFGLLYLVGLVL